MRKYQAIWEQLKSKGSAKLVAKPDAHKRIIKAVTKEKYNDIGYKFELAQEDNIAVLSKEINGNIITFYLEVRLKSTII